MGMHITRHQQTRRVAAQLLKRCNNFAHVGRTVEGRITVVRAMILTSIWYVMGVLPTSLNEAKKIETIVNNFINGADVNEWDEQTKRGNMSKVWFYRSKRLGGWGLTPVARSLKTRKLVMIKRFIEEQESGITKPWHVLATQMTQEYLQGWCNDWTGILLWNGDQKLGDFANGQGDALSPWWRDAWKEWLQLRCEPERNSIPRAQLLDWPLWNNRVLSKGHGINNVLYRSFTNSDTRAHMKTIRLQGFKTFKDFMLPNGSIMNGSALYTAVTVSLSVHQSDQVVPQHACDTLSRIIRALWANACKNWLKETSQQQQHQRVNWWPQAKSNTPFSKASNSKIADMIRAREPVQQQPKLIKLHNQPITICWRRERSTLKVLAPTRADLMRRLIRNALPLGFKRVHWPTEVQTKCMLCQSDAVETAEHLFWDCTFAKQSWGSLHHPWRNHNRSRPKWREAMIGYEVRLGQVDRAHTERLWAITRAFIIRVIWLERNRRYFYPELQHRTPTFRHHQGKDDIKAHIESWFRRGDATTRGILKDALAYISALHTDFNTIAFHMPTNPDNPVNS